MGFFKAFAIAAAALCASGASTAAIVTLSGFSTGSAHLDVRGPNVSTDAGRFSGQVDFGGGPQSLLTYCTDLLQNTYFNSPGTDYQLRSGVSAWGIQKAADLGRVLTVASGFGTPNNADQSAVIQAAIWEVIYESSNHYSFKSGSFKAKGSGSTQALLNASEEFWDRLSLITPTFAVDKLFSPTRQDYLIATALPQAPAEVPEPGSLALGITALAGMGFSARKRWQRA